MFRRNRHEQLWARREVTAPLRRRSFGPGGGDHRRTLGGVTPYAVLGVAPTMSTTEIEAAYRRLLREHHPDLHAMGTAEEQVAAEQRTRELTTAMEAIRADRSYGWGPEAPDARAEGEGPFVGLDEEERVRRLQRLASYNQDRALIDRLSEGLGAQPAEQSRQDHRSDDRFVALMGLVLALSVALIAALMLLEAFS